MTGIGQTGPHRHDTALGLLDTLDDEYSPVLDGADSSAVYINEVSSSAYLATLLQLCLSDVAVEGDVFVFGID